jgi:hypothetical protein
VIFALDKCKYNIKVKKSYAAPCQFVKNAIENSDEIDVRINLNASNARNYKVMLHIADYLNILQGTDIVVPDITQLKANGSKPFYSEYPEVVKYIDELYKEDAAIFYDIIQTCGFLGLESLLQVVACKFAISYEDDIQNFLEDLESLIIGGKLLEND